MIDRVVSLLGEPGQQVGLEFEAGVVTAEEDATLEVVGQFTLPLARIREAWQATIPAAMHV